MKYALVKIGFAQTPALPSFPKISRHDSRLTQKREIRHCYRAIVTQLSCDKISTRYQ